MELPQDLKNYEAPSDGNVLDDVIGGLCTALLVGIALACIAAWVVATFALEAMS